MSKVKMAEAPAEHIIRTVDLSMVYRSGRVEVPALRNVDLMVAPGEFVAIMGPSGCGKSTLLHLLGGLQQATKGQVMIEGIDIARLSDAERTAVRRRKVGFIFQRFNLLPTLSAKGNIELAKKIHGNGKVMPYRSEEIIDMLGIADKINFRPVELSGGEQQRVAIARALIHNPSLVLADEPTASLDTERAYQVVETFAGLIHEQNRSGIMVTHDLRMVEFVDRVLLMRDGKLVQVLSAPNEILQLARGGKHN
jgi:hemin transport system ATP-binding protein